MSSYVNFYVGWKGTYIPIGDYSRSTKLYQFMSEEIEFEGARVGDFFDVIIERMRKEITFYEKTIENNERLIEDVVHMEDIKIHERIDEILEIRSENEGHMREIDELNEAINFLRVVNDMRDEYYGVEVYVGIECGVETLEENFGKN
jgi:hypothetical protein